MYTVEYGMCMFLLVPLPYLVPSPRWSEILVRNRDFFILPFT